MIVQNLSIVIVKTILIVEKKTKLTIHKIESLGKNVSYSNRLTDLKNMSHFIACFDCLEFVMQSAYEFSS